MNCKLSIREKMHTFYLDNIMSAFELFHKVHKVFPNEKTKKYELFFFNPEHFIKSDESSARSIASILRSDFERYGDLVEEKEIKEFEQDFEKALLLLTDFTRMNIQINDSEPFEKTSIEVLKAIKGIDGIDINTRKTIPFKNGFTSKKGCKDFKVFLLYRGSIPFEVQLHNESSEKINLATHGLYEVYRSDSIDGEFKELLARDRQKLYDLVKKPEFDENKLLKEGIGYE